MAGIPFRRQRLLNIAGGGLEENNPMNPNGPAGWQIAGGAADQHSSVVNQSNSGKKQSVFAGLAELGADVTSIAGQFNDKNTMPKMEADPNSIAGATIDNQSLNAPSMQADPNSIAGGMNEQTPQVWNPTQKDFEMVPGENDPPVGLAPMTEEQRAAMQVEPQGRGTGEIQPGEGLSMPTNDPDAPQSLKPMSEEDFRAMQVEPQGRGTNERLPEGAGLPQPPDKPKTRTSDDIYAEIQEEKTLPVVKETSLWNRIKSGAWNGFLEWGRHGEPTLESLGGAMIGTTAMAAKSPEGLAEFKRHGRVERLTDEYVQQSGLEGMQTQNKLRQAQAEYAEQRPDIERQKLQTRIQQEAMRQRGKIEYLRQQNANKEDDWKEYVKDGKIWKLYKNRDGKDGRPIIEPLIDPETNEQMTPIEDQLYDYRDASGQTIKVKGRDIIYAEAGNADRNLRAQTYNSSADQKYDDDVYNWSQNLTKAGGDVSRYDNELAGLIQQDAVLAQQETTLAAEVQALEGQPLRADEYKVKAAQLAKIREDRTKIVADQGKLKGEKQKAVDLYENLQRNKPQRPTSVTATQTNEKKVSKADVQKVADDNKMSYDQAKKWAESQGWTVIE